MAISEITPQQARERQRQGALLVDIRETHERASGQAEGAIGIAKAELEAAPGHHLPSMQAPVLLICQSGRRSAATAGVLQAAGYIDVHSVAGGTTAWVEAALPVVRPQLEPDEAILLKCYDSKDDGRARFTAHTAFTDPTSPPEAAPRESIEVRALVFFAPENQDAEPAMPRAVGTTAPAAN